MRVLLVDDEPNIRRTLRLTLEPMGHSIAEASSCESAMRELELVSHRRRVRRSSARS